MKTTVNRTLQIGRATNRFLLHIEVLSNYLLHLILNGGPLDINSLHFISRYVDDTV